MLVKGGAFTKPQLRDGCIRTVHVYAARHLGKEVALQIAR